MHYQSVALAVSLNAEILHTMAASFVKFVFLFFCFCIVSSDYKSHYTTIPGTNSKMWEPILAEYLTETIGSEFSPSITFEVIPVNYNVDSSSPALARAGRFYFLC